MGNAASHVQHLFCAGASDPRIFNTGMVTPRRMVQSQRPGQSGNRYPTTVINQSEWAEAQVEGAFDKADLVLLLASAFWYKRDASGNFQFQALAGGIPSGYSSPKQWTKFQSYNWRGPSSGPSYEAASLIMQSLEMNFNRRDDTMLTAAFAAKQYREIAQPGTAPVPNAVNPAVVRNSDIRIGLSAGRPGEIVYPTSILSSRWSYTDLIELVFSANQSDRGWTDFVEAQIESTLNVRFMATNDYLEYANVDADTFFVLSDAAGTFEWAHRARFVDVPDGPGGKQNLQEVEISFLPFARVEANRSDLALSFTAAQGAGVDSAKTGLRTSGTSIGTDLVKTDGYLPAGLDTILWDDADDILMLGTADAAGDEWPTNWEPTTIKIGSSTVQNLTYDATSRTWRTPTIATNPLTVGSQTATILWKWTPATYMSGFVNGSGVAALCLSSPTFSGRGRRWRLRTTVGRGGSCTIHRAGWWPGTCGRPRNG